MPSKDMVQVSPQETIRRNPGESDAQVRARHAKEQRAAAERARQLKSDSRFYKHLEGKDPFYKAGAEIERAARKKLGLSQEAYFKKGGHVKKPAAKPVTRLVRKKK